MWCDKKVVDQYLNTTIMSFPRAPPSLLDDGQPGVPGRSTPRGPILDPESRDKRLKDEGTLIDSRQKAATVLETWDLQAMHALNSGEVCMFQDEQAKRRV
jgi:hypothetical protein